MGTGLPLGDFGCVVTFETVRPPNPVIKEEGGATYVVQGDYEIAFQTVLRFASGAELPVKAKPFGELSQKVVVRDENGRPSHLSGYTQGRSEIADRDGNLIFQGRYYDTRTFQSVAGDDVLTPVGTHIFLRPLDQWFRQRSFCRSRLLARRTSDP